MLLQKEGTCKQGHLKKVAKNHIQAGLEYVQWGKLHKLTGQLVSSAITLRVKKFSSYSGESVIVSVPIAPCFDVGHHWRIWLFLTAAFRIYGW